MIGAADGARRSRPRRTPETAAAAAPATPRARPAWAGTARTRAPRPPRVTTTTTIEARELPAGERVQPFPDPHARDAIEGPRRTVTWRHGPDASQLLRDEVHEAGERARSPCARSRPSSARTTPSAARAGLERGGLADVGRHLELGPHLAVDLHHHRDGVLDDEGGVERAATRTRAPTTPPRARPATAPRRRTARTAPASGRAPAPRRCAPPPPSSAERISFVSTCSLEMAVLNRNRSRSSVTPLIVRWVRRTSSGSATSAPRRHRLVHGREHPPEPGVHARAAGWDRRPR